MTNKTHKLQKITATALLPLVILGTGISPALAVETPVPAIEQVNSVYSTTDNRFFQAYSTGENTVSIDIEDVDYIEYITFTFSGEGLEDITQVKNAWEDRNHEASIGTIAKYDFEGISNGYTTVTATAESTVPQEMYPEATDINVTKQIGEMNATPSKVNYTMMYWNTPYPITNFNIDFLKPYKNGTSEITSYEITVEKLNQETNTYGPVETVSFPAETFTASEWDENTLSGTIELPVEANSQYRTNIYAVNDSGRSGVSPHMYDLETELKDWYYMRAVDSGNITGTSNNTLDVTFEKRFGYSNENNLLEEIYTVDLYDQETGELVESKEIEYNNEHYHYYQNVEVGLNPDPSGENHYTVSFDNLKQNHSYYATISGYTSVIPERQTTPVTVSGTTQNNFIGALENIEATVNNKNQGTITWTIPENTTNDSYELTLKDAEGNVITTWTETDGNATTSDIPFNLANDTNYIVEVTAINQYGNTTAETTLSTNDILPAAEIENIEVIVAEDNTTTISWDKTEGSEIDEYELVITDKDGKEIGRWTVDGDKTETEVPFELEEGTDYNVEITAKNEHKNSTNDKDFTTNIIGAAPADIENVVTTVDEENNVTIEWDAPEEDTVDEYELVITDKDGKEIGRWTVDGDETSTDVPFELEEGTDYNVEITAKNENGSSTAEDSFTTNTLDNGNANGNGNENENGNANGNANEDSIKNAIPLAKTGSENNFSLMLLFSGLLAIAGGWLVSLRKKFKN